MSSAPVEDVQLAEEEEKEEYEAEEEDEEEKDVVEVHNQGVEAMGGSSICYRHLEAMDYALSRFPHDAWRMLPTCRWFKTEANSRAARRSAFQYIGSECEKWLGDPENELNVFADTFLRKLAAHLVRHCPFPSGRRIEPLNADAFAANETASQMVQRAANIAKRCASFEDIDGQPPVGDDQLALCSRELLRLSREVPKWYNTHGHTRFVVQNEGAARDYADSEVRTVTAPTSYVTRSDRPTTLSSSSDAPDDDDDDDDEDAVDISQGDGHPDAGDAGVVLQMSPSPEKLRRIDQTGLVTRGAFDLLREDWGERLPSQKRSSGIAGFSLHMLAKCVRWDENALVSKDVMGRIEAVEKRRDLEQVRYYAQTLHWFATALKARVLSTPEGEGKFDLLLRDTQDVVQEKLKKRKDEARKRHRRAFPKRNLPRQRRGMSAAEVQANGGGAGPWRRLVEERQRRMAEEEAEERERRMAEVQAQERRFEEEIRAIDASWAEEEAKVEAQNLSEIRSWLPTLKELCARRQQAQELVCYAMAYFSTVELDGTLVGLTMLVLGFVRRDQLLFHKRLNLLSHRYRHNQDEDSRTLVRLSQACCLHLEQRHRMPDSLHFFCIAQGELLRDTELLGGAYAIACTEALKETVGSERQWHLKERVVNLVTTLGERGEESRLLKQPQHQHKVKQILGRS